MHADIPCLIRSGLGMYDVMTKRRSMFVFQFVGGLLSCADAAHTVPTFWFGKGEANAFQKALFTVLGVMKEEWVGIENVEVHCRSHIAF